MHEADNKNFDGMTVNERIYESGKIDIFDKFVKENDVIGMCYLLNSVNIDLENAREILKKIGMIK